MVILHESFHRNGNLALRIKRPDFMKCNYVESHRMDGSLLYKGYLKRRLEMGLHIETIIRGATIR